MTSAPGSPQPEELLILNQVVGPLARDLAEDLAESGVRVRVLTGWADLPEGYEPRFELVNGIALRKAPLWRRVWTWGWFTVQACWQVVRKPSRPVMVVTNPPWVMLAMPILNLLLRVRYVVQVYDIYPEVGEVMGMLRKGGMFSRLWRRCSRWSLVRSEGVVTLGSSMARTVRGHLRDGDSLDVEVIPNWADVDTIRPRTRAENPFAQEHGLGDMVVVTYSGALGATHDTDSILEAALELVGVPNVHFMIIGGGTRWAEVKQRVEELGLPNLTLLPLQPWETVPFSLAATDLAITCLDEGYEGVSVPSKTYPALAAGAALLAVSSPGTELEELIQEHECGFHLTPRDPGRLARIVREMAGDRARLNELQWNARRAAETCFSRATCTQQYIDWLGQTLGEAPQANRPGIETGANPSDRSAGQS